MPASLSNRRWVLVALGGALSAGCHRGPSLPPPPPAVTVPFDTAPPTPPPPPLDEVRRTRTDTALSAAEREAIVREVQARRAAWRARGITDYRIRVAVGCFCPWPQTPAILEVKGGVAVALRDTVGRAFGSVREPWSNYTVEGLFDAVEQGARRSDVIEVTYDGRFGHPTYIRGTGRLGLPDNWFWVRATGLTPQP
jgi:hypothetical protein